MAYFRAGEPIAKALAERLGKAGVQPIVQCSEPQVFAARHAAGDVEYLFLANAKTDEREVKQLHWNGIMAATAQVSLPADGRPLYDAIVGGEAGEFKSAAGA